MAGGVLLQVLYPPSCMFNTESVMGIKPGDYGVLSGHQVDEFTHIWLAE